MGTVVVFILVISACNTNQKSSDDKTVEIHAESTASSKQNWPENKLSKVFKIDTSNFEILAAQDRWWVSLETTASFESQLKKIKQATVKISLETDLSDLERVVILPINDELLSNIASVPEIQSELIQRNGKVNSMETVTPNAYKSKYLTRITDIFQTFGLEASDYYIDKCHGEEIQGDSLFYTLECATISFRLKKIEQK